MTELDRRLSDIPEGALRWTSDRRAREHAGSDTWYVFLPRETVRCPFCSHALTEFGPGQGVAVRIHPDQRRDPITNHQVGPTSVQGEARSCPRCRKHLDMRFLPIVKLAQPPDSS
jgi:hypothetical protein